MPIYVFVCDKSEILKLEKALAYDPYLDTSIIPSLPDIELEKLSKEQKDTFEKESNERLKKLAQLKADPYFDVIFARQEYEVLNGTMLGLNNNNYYIYLKANQEFLDKAQNKLKQMFTSVHRAEKEIEDKVILFIDERNNKAQAGFGAIFG